MKTKSEYHVEELDRYGKSLTDIPKEAFQGQTKLMIAAFIKECGLLGIIPFAFKVLKERNFLRKKYAFQYKKLFSLTPKGAKEIVVMIAMFNVLARKKSRAEAYEFVRGLFQGISPNSLRSIYQLDDLVQCKGDRFTNFKKFNIAMFRAGDRDFHVSEITENENHLRIVVDRCLNVEAGEMFECPEIAKLGCDHDLAAYPYVEPHVDAIFRRPCTLAKGGTCCDFNFYRKGFEPVLDKVNQ